MAKERFNTETLERLISRLFKAKWIAGDQRTLPKSFRLTLTTKGAERLRYLGKCFHPADKLKLIDRLLNPIRFIIAAAPLHQGKRMNSAEVELLWALSALHVREGDGQSLILWGLFGNPE
jgi:hypothetical protein